MIRGTFSPRLFFVKTKTLSPIVGALSKMPVKKSGLGILNPVMSAQEKYLRSQRGSAELVQDVKGGGSFFNSSHLWNLSEKQRYGKKYRYYAYKSKVKGL